MKGHRCRARTCPHPPTPLLTLIYLVLYWSANTFVPPLCVAGSLLVSVDLCCCAEWVTSASWFNLGYTRLKRDWIKDAEGLDLPVLAVSSCLLLLFRSVFLPLTHLGCAGHWPPRCLCWPATPHTASECAVFRLPVLFHITSPRLDLLARVVCGHYIYSTRILPKESTHTRKSLQRLSAVLDNLISSIYPCNPTFSCCPSLSALGWLTLCFKWRKPFSSSTHRLILN